MMISTIGPFARPIPEGPLRHVAAVVPAIELRDIRLVDLSCALEAALPEPPFTASLSHEVKANVVDGNALVILVRFFLRATGRGDPSVEFLRLSAAFQLSYVGKDLNTLAPEQLSAFAGVNSVHNAWPYLRELINSMTTRMGLPALTVPLLKVRQPKSVTRSKTKAKK